MKILVITQKVDRSDSVLGFFHRWIEEFSKNFTQVTVICLEKGEYDFSDNVQVLSLGKEDKKSKIVKLFQLYRYIFSQRANYDVVFVHMNQEYVLLAGVFWKMMKKKIVMWRNHPDGSFLTDIAGILCDKVFCTSRYSYTAKYKKTVIMPVGIDTNIFSYTTEESRLPQSILFLARIAPSKKVEIFLEAIKNLKDKSVVYSATVVGDPLPKDREYYYALKMYVEENNIPVSFKKGVPNTETVSLYRKCDIFVNTSSSGMYDKTIFEAMACGAISVVSNENLRGVIPSECVFTNDNVAELTQKLETILEYPASKKRELACKLRAYVEEHHSITSLFEMIHKELYER